MIFFNFVTIILKDKNFMKILKNFAVGAIALTLTSCEQKSNMMY